MDNFFQKLSDKDFYSDKLTHIYFNSKVEDKTIDELIVKIKEANNLENPKPILIHICSFGGNLTDGLRLLTIFKLSKVPIATMIDNYSCSAATFLSISSPYRVMNKYGYCLLHEYSISGFVNKKRDVFINSLKAIDKYFNVIIDMYLEKTKYSKQELLELLQHNIFLDYKTCLSKGIVDRVIDVHYSTPIENLKINDLIKSRNVIHLAISCDFNLSNIDLSIMTSNANPNKNSYLIYPNHEDCDEIEKQKDKAKIKTSDVLTDRNIFKTLNVIPRISSINTTKIGIIDTPISIDNLIPLLFTDKIYMYKHTFIICNLIYFYNMNNSILLDDNVKNTKLLMNTIKTILKKKTKMKLSDISNINRKFLIVDSKQAKDWGLCHEIID
jgi:ATP-dependent protease ClpP protease subunit